MDTISTWIAALLTLAIFSFLYRENPIYRFAEHLLVGVSAGYYLVQYFYSAVYKKLWVPVFQEGQWALLPGGILGVMLLLRLHRRTAWLSRYAIAFFVAAWSGYLIPSILQAQVLTQMRGTIVGPYAGTGLWDYISSWILLAGVISILVYFYFSQEHKGVIRGVSKIGITFLMVGFGASFGYTIMGRITLLVGRFQFLFYDWLHLGTR